MIESFCGKMPSIATIFAASRRLPTCWYPLCWLVVFGQAVFGLAAPMHLLASPQTDAPATAVTPKKYSPSVAAKADQILLENGLQRSGKQLKTDKTAAIGRSLSKLGREKRSIRQASKDWQAAKQRAQAARAKFRTLTDQQAQLNLQLAQVAGRSVSANNQIVGLIKANEAQMSLMLPQLKEMDQMAADKRSLLSAAEAEYETSILAIRQTLDAVRSELTQTLAKNDVQTAIKVSHVNFQTPYPITADDLLSPTQRRVEKIEQAVFREAIELTVEGRTFSTDVVVGRKSIRMVVDSGADLVTLSQTAAQTLGISVPNGAPKLILVMADGSRTTGHRVTLPNMRLGNFAAENVDAVVLSSAAGDAVPLLGMSYLGNFKFEIDAANRQLKLLRIDPE